MESRNVHYHHHQLQLQLQDHQLVASSPSNCYGVDNSSNIIIGPSNIETLISPRDTTHHNDYVSPSQSSSIINQDLGFQWANSNITGSFTSQLGHDLHLARIKGEFSDSYQKFTEMLQSSPSSIEELQFNHLIKNEQGDHLGDLTEKLLLRNFSSDCQINGVQFPPANKDFYACLGNEITPTRGNFSQIFPTINVSALNRSPNSASSSSLDVNMQALDLFNSGGFVNDHSFYKESFSNYGIDQLQQSIHRPSNNLNKVSPFNSGITEAKRRSTSLEQKVPLKKSRSEPRTSCPPFKVRKEKLGDRIANLQQLVAPYGKTDTASVLMEAIGYIKFLQNQVETLSVPYMKSSRNKNSRTMMRGSLSEDGGEEGKRDLQSRGLCLVPLSCLSYVTDGGGGVWPPPNFNS